MENLSPLKRPLILGAHGQLGRAFSELLGPLALTASRKEADLSQPEACLDFIKKIRPTAILNAAAYTQVDLAEKEEALALKINGETPGLIAKWCAQETIPFVHFSTDYVFSGEGTAPWRETDPVSPLSAYGRTKLEGERRIVEAGGLHLIFRTSWVYDAHGKNFLTTMLRLGKEREILRVVSDQIGAPTFAADLARGAVQALGHAAKKPSFPSGIYHLCNAGETSWHHFAEQIFAFAALKNIPLQVKKVEPISTSDYPTPAQRPKNSRLSHQKVEQTLGIQLPNWKESLKTCMEELP